MSHNGNSFALAFRDKIVGHALETDNASINYQKGDSFSAAMVDFGGNLFLGAVPQTLMGFGVVIPYISTSIQGWIGGIVSIDSAHKSRFKNFKSTFYYFFVILLQYIPYSPLARVYYACTINLVIYIAETKGILIFAKPCQTSIKYSKVMILIL
jgi:hypothetical protein